MHAAQATEQAISQPQQPEALHAWDQQQYAPASVSPQDTYAPAFSELQSLPSSTAQTKHNISGNPFADPEPLAEMSNNLDQESPSVNLISPEQPGYGLGSWPPLPAASEQMLQQRAFAAHQLDTTWGAAGSDSAVQPAPPGIKQVIKHVIAGHPW